MGKKKGRKIPTLFLLVSGHGTENYYRCSWRLFNFHGLLCSRSKCLKVGRGRPHGLVRGLTWRAPMILSHSLYYLTHCGASLDCLKPHPSMHISIHGFVDRQKVTLYGEYF
ncbi:hypothetical protein ABZP36_006205 [Zizania latifolia]